MHVINMWYRNRSEMWVKLLPFSYIKHAAVTIINSKKWVKLLPVSYYKTCMHMLYIKPAKVSIIFYIYFRYTKLSLAPAGLIYNQQMFILITIHVTNALETIFSMRNAEIQRCSQWRRYSKIVHETNKTTKCRHNGLVSKPERSSITMPKLSVGNQHNQTKRHLIVLNFNSFTILSTRATCWFPLLLVHFLLI